MGWTNSTLVKRSLLAAGAIFLIIAIAEFAFRELVVRPEAERLFVEYFDLENLVENELDEPRSFEFAYYLDDRLRICDSCTSDRVFSNAKRLFSSIKQPDRSVIFYEVFRACPENTECLPFEGRDISLVAVSENTVLPILRTDSSVVQCVDKVVSFYRAKLCRFDKFYIEDIYRSSLFSLSLEFPKTALLDRCCGQGSMQIGTKGLAVDWVAGIAWRNTAVPSSEDEIRSDEL